MPRPRSDRVHEVKAALAARLRSGVLHPGQRFLSARAVAARFAISYQTAHRLLAEFEAEGKLQRRAASGSYVPGEQVKLHGAQLVFHSRARRKGSFGAYLLAEVEAALRRAQVPFVCSWADDDRTPHLREDHYPVVWECRPAIQAAATGRRFALSLNDTPPPGLSGSFVDAITTDDYSGGACADELLKAHAPRADELAVLGGPKDDPRSERRIAGFCSHAPRARVVSADSWFVEPARGAAVTLLRSRPAGIFACNDRLAQAVLDAARELRRPVPPLIGFDNAPIAERLGLTTIGIPWENVVSQAVQLIDARCRGDTGRAKILTLPHEPVMRFTS